MGNLFVNRLSNTHKNFLPILILVSIRLTMQLGSVSSYMTSLYRFFYVVDVLPICCLAFGVIWFIEIVLSISMGYTPPIITLKKSPSEKSSFKFIHVVLWPVCHLNGHFSPMILDYKRRIRLIAWAVWASTCVEVNYVTYKEIVLIKEGEGRVWPDSLRSDSCRGTRGGT